MDSLTVVLVIILTIIFPPIGVAIVADCGADLLINLILTLFGYFPGHIHAFYILYVYYTRHEDSRRNTGVQHSRAPGILSERVQRGGLASGSVTNYSTTGAPHRAAAPPAASYGATGGPADGNGQQAGIATAPVAQAPVGSDTKYNQPAGYQ